MFLPVPALRCLEVGGHAWESGDGFECGLILGGLFLGVEERG